MANTRRTWSDAFLGPFRTIGKLLLFGVGLGFAGAIVAFVFVLSMLPGLPDIESEEHTSLKVPLRVYSREGALLGEFGDEKRDPVAIETVPPLLIKAILAAEDNQFYEHLGIDISGIVRAIIANLRSGGVRQGASTITMQVARNYFLTPERTYTRKIKEMLLAVNLERRFNKDQILELYINKIFLGHRAYGFSTAARTYYDTGLEGLTLAQIAMLAALPKAPSRDNPLSSPDHAKTRRDYVLGRMLELRYINDAQYQAAADAALSAARHGPALEHAPYIAEMARLYMIEKYGEQVYEDGYRVYTTVSAPLQIAARRALRKSLDAYDKRHGYRGAVAEIPLSGFDLGAATAQERAELEDQWRDELARHPLLGALRPALILRVNKQSAEALTVTGKRIVLPWQGLQWAQRHLDADTLGPKPRTAGEVLRPGHVVYVRRKGEAWALDQAPAAAGALVSINTNDGAIHSIIGGYDFVLTKFNRASQAKRQPGSNIKPFIYSAALENDFTAATAVSGGPIVGEDDGQGNVWRPQNYAGRFSGPTPLRRALSRSLNLVSVRLLRTITPQFGARYMQRFGFRPEDMPDGLPLALGAASFTPLEVVRAYGVFANGGYLVEPYFISHVEDRDGSIIESANPAVVCDYCDAGAPDAHGTAAAFAGTAARRLAPRVVNPANAFIMNDMLREVVRSGTGRKARSLERKDLGGKTGTTDEFKDAWFSGFSRDVATTVWIGFDQSQGLGRGEAGSKAALPGWIEYMGSALQGLPQNVLQPPDSVVQTWVSTDTGHPTAPGSRKSHPEYFIAGTEPAPGAVRSGGTDEDSAAPSSDSPDSDLF